MTRLAKLFSSAYETEQTARSKTLIVTADDFGLAPEVNDAVEQAHRNGILSAASLMVAGRAAADAVARARRLPRLRVGLHVVLTDGASVLPPECIPDLVDPNGRLRTDMVRLGIDVFLRARVRRQLRAEIQAQFAAYRATGLALDHVNAHHHFHLHPSVGAELVRAAAEHGSAGIRIPQEPAEILRQIDPAVRAPSTALIAPWAALLRARARQHRLRAPERVFGLAWSGAMTATRVLGVLRHLPPGATEIYLHPATANAFAEAAPGYRYSEELAALTTVEVIAAARASGLRLGGFCDLA